MGVNVWEEASREEAWKAYWEAVDADFVPEKVRKKVEDLLVKADEHAVLAVDPKFFAILPPDPNRFRLVSEYNTDGLLYLGAAQPIANKWAAKWWKHNGWDNTWGW